MPEALNLPNGVYGMFFYSSMALLSKFCWPTFKSWLIPLIFSGLTNNLGLLKLQLLLSVLSNIFSIYLAYILFFILAEICVICIATYFVNVVSFILILRKLNQMQIKMK
jgi:vitamin-K-epoxide reductase (warfarin-sensitive)